jgi:hypothetical protein
MQPFPVSSLLMDFAVSQRSRRASIVPPTNSLVFRARREWLELMGYFVMDAYEWRTLRTLLAPGLFHRISKRIRKQTAQNARSEQKVLLH